MTLHPSTPRTPYSPPLSRLEHRATAVLLRDLLAEPAVVSEMRADPYIAAQFNDLLAPNPPTHATTATPLSPDTISAPDSTSLSPSHAANESGAQSNSTSSASAEPRPGASSAPETHTALPLRNRIYALYCEGHPISAIARDLARDRGTVTRHLRAVESELAADHTAGLARPRLRAVEAQYAILAAAAVAREQRDRPPAPYRAQRARLLSVATHAARTAAQLQGLFTPSALAGTLRDHPDTPAVMFPAANSNHAAECRRTSWPWDAGWCREIELRGASAWGAL